MSKTDLSPINTVEWNEINWRKVEKSVFKLQKRIYQANIDGNVRLLRRLQKTQVRHTLKYHEGQKPGFDFLGFTIRQFPAGKCQSGKKGNGQLLGFKTIIKPSEKAIK